MKNKLKISIGSSSIVLIFVTLCLVSFAALSLISAKADNNLSRKLAENTFAYYEASSKAQVFIKDMDEAFAHTYLVLDGEEAFYQNLSTFIEQDFPISDSQVLHVKLAPNYPQNPEDKFTKILEYKVVNITNFEYDDTLHVLKQDSYEETEK